MLRSLTLLGLIATSALAAPSFEPIVKGLKEPLWACAPKNETRYLWILEKAGVIKIYDKKTKKVLATPFMDITDRIRIRMNEQGLLGMTFCPNYAKTGRFYLNYTNRDGNTEIYRFVVSSKSPLKCNPASGEQLMAIKQDSRNHNGGWIDFGPDKLLYIGMGDGGSANDPKHRAQDLSSHLGKILRIDVSGARGYTVPKSNPFTEVKGAKPEIWAYGLRNPWRCSWDRKTKDFYIADVGQNKIEEINMIPAGRPSAGLNYGWRFREGNIVTPKRGVGGDRPTRNVDPVYTYTHGAKSNQGLSVTGGYVYRGKIASLRGQYFFADWVLPHIWSIKVKNGKVSQFTDWTTKIQPKNDAKITRICSFAEDPQGELYLISHKGIIYQLVDQ